ncbi:MAG: hypothetical protein HW416_3899 [Chloroflexi bacterium]|nr:hypothetical protein [Chloroflexota bacterium]
MRAVVAQQANTSLAVAEGDQVLSKQAHSERVTVWNGELGREQEWVPVLAQEFAHDRARPNPAEQLIVFYGQHDFLLESRRLRYLPWRPGSSIRAEPGAAWEGASYARLA